MTYPDGSVVDRLYTDRNQLQEVKWNAAVVHTRTYDAGGRLLSTVHGNGLKTDFRYRVDNLVSKILSRPVGNTKVDNYSYDYDANKNKISGQEKVTRDR